VTSDRFCFEPEEERNVTRTHAGGWIAAIGLVSGIAAGQTVVYTGPGGPLPDAGIDEFGETVPTTVSFDINIADPGQIASLEVELTDLFHTWSGDLTISVTHLPSATSAILVDRVGYPEVGPFGSFFPYEGTYTFSDLASAQLPADSLLTPGVYLPEQALSAFAGLGAAGTWRLSVTDSAGEDEGSLGSWSLHVTYVPAPAATVLFAGLGLTGRRRR
jgi:hypothetical protein